MIWYFVCAILGLSAGLAINVTPHAKKVEREMKSENDALRNAVKDAIQKYEGYIAIQEKLKSEYLDLRDKYNQLARKANIL